MIVEESILINAELNKIWDTFTDLTCWKNWNSVIRDVDSQSTCLVEGCQLVCNFRPFFFPINVSIEIKEVKDRKSISWVAKKTGLIAEHLFDFQEMENGVLVTSREEFDGFFIRNAEFFVPKQKIQDLTRIFLNDLKRAAEMGSGLES